MTLFRTVSRAAAPPCNFLVPFVEVASDHARYISVGDPGPFRVHIPVARTQRPVPACLSARHSGRPFASPMPVHPSAMRTIPVRSYSRPSPVHSAQSHCTRYAISSSLRPWSAGRVGFLGLCTMTSLGRLQHTRRCYFTAFRLYFE